MLAWSEAIQTRLRGVGGWGDSEGQFVLFDPGLLPSINDVFRNLDCGIGTHRITRREYQLKHW